MEQITETFFPIVLGVLFLIGIGMTTVQACTGIRLMANDKGVVYGRTMEWGHFDLNSRVAVIPRGYAFTGTTPDGWNGKKWTAKYGVVGLDMLGKDILADGMNEKGLAVGLFYHPGFAGYPEYDRSKADDSITAVDVTNYILTQYATIDEVRKGMAAVRVVPVVEKAIGIQTDGHWLVTSPEGESIVIEFTNGAMKIHEAPLGVITNAPEYDWHMTNLRNYVNLSQTAFPGKKIEKLDFKPLGSGSGMIGLPGDFTPPSRLIRAVAYTQTARPTDTAKETVYELFRILDNFNLPLGAAEGAGAIDTHDMRSSTIWTTAWDLSNKVLNYHTQHNRRIRSFDLKSVDFANLQGEIVHIPLDNKKEQDIEHLSIQM